MQVVQDSTDKYAFANTCGILRPLLTLQIELFSRDVLEMIEDPAVAAQPDHARAQLLQVSHHSALEASSA